MSRSTIDYDGFCEGCGEYVDDCLCCDWCGMGPALCDCDTCWGCGEPNDSCTCDDTEAD